MGNPVVHFEVVGKDASGLQRFYANAFGWEMKPAIPGYAMAHPNAAGSINGGVGAAPREGLATSPSTLKFRILPPHWARSRS